MQNVTQSYNGLIKYDIPLVNIMLQLIGILPKTQHLETKGSSTGDPGCGDLIKLGLQGHLSSGPNKSYSAF